MLFDVSQLPHILIVGPLAYVGIIVLMRASGKRTLSKMNAFDFVVTVALGSILATVLLDTTVSLLEGLAGLAVLIGGQFVLTWLSVRSDRVRHLIKAQPALLYHRGDYLQDALLRERVTRSEVLAAVRENGHGSLDAIEAVVLETDGSFSVLSSAPREGDSSLRGVTPLSDER